MSFGKEHRKGELLFNTKYIKNFHLLGIEMGIKT